MAAYGVLLLLVASIGAATTALYKFIPSKDGTFYYSNGELERGTEVRHLNPLLDIKLRILADYPVEKLSRARDTTIQQVNDAETFRAVYYNLFLLSDWDEIKRLLAIIPGNKSFALDVKSDKIESIVELLDSTLLAAAYLYERLGMSEAAAHFYSLYLDCLRPSGFSSPGTDDHVLGKRLMIGRLKYYYLTEYVRFQPVKYPSVSYLNQMLEDRLSWMIDHRLAGYRDALGPASYDSAPLLELIQTSDPRVQPFLKYEACIVVIRRAARSADLTDATINEACSHPVPRSKDHYLTSFARAAYIFHRIRRYTAKIDDGSAADPAELKEIELAAKAFYDWHAKEAEFLVDDIKVKFAAIAGNEKDRNRLLCEVAKYPFPQYDFAPYAAKALKEKGIKCD